MLLIGQQHLGVGVNEKVFDQAVKPQRRSVDVPRHFRNANRIHQLAVGHKQV